MSDAKHTPTPMTTRISMDRAQRIAAILERYGYSDDAQYLLVDRLDSHDALVAAAEHAREVLSTLYAKYGTAIGPYSSQAQLCNVELGAALKDAQVKP